MTVRMMQTDSLNDSIFNLQGVSPTVLALFYLVQVETVGDLLDAALDLKGDFENIKFNALPDPHKSPLKIADEEAIIKALQAHPATAEGAKAFKPVSNKLLGKLPVRVDRNGIWKK